MVRMRRGVAVLHVHLRGTLYGALFLYLETLVSRELGGRGGWGCVALGVQVPVACGLSASRPLCPGVPQ